MISGFLKSASPLGAEMTYLDDGNNHAIINLANQSFILIQSQKGITANFQTIRDGLMFPFTFEVNGEKRILKGTTSVSCGWRGFSHAC